MTPGVGAPRARVVVGAGFAPDPFGAESREVSPPDPALLDSDRDGIDDAEDHCPEEPEDFDRFEDEDGCPEADNDGDGIDDIDDECPDRAENRNGMDDHDGCPDADRDGDGMPDHRDQCPDAAEDADGFEDADGCPDEDNDYDTFPDSEDECPMLPESPGRQAEPDGCPDTYRIEDGRVVWRWRVRFDGDELSPASRPMISDLADGIIANPGWREVRIVVHTSGRGHPERNLGLSARRAIGIREHLESLGVDPRRLVAEGRGDEQPVASPDTPEGRRANARVEVHVSTGGEGGEP